MKLKLLTPLYLSILLLASYISVLNAEESSKPITIIGTNNNLPFSHTLPDGTKTGLYVEFWQLWSEVNDIPIEIILTSFDESLQRVREGGAIHTGLFVNEERKQWADFSLPIHSVDTGILYNQKFLTSNKLIDRKNIQVAVQTNSFQAAFLKRNLPAISLSYYNEIDIGINQLLNNESQALVAEIPPLKAQLAKRGLHGVFTLSDEVLVNNKVHAMIAQGQTELLNKINSGIKNMPINILIELEKRWLPTLKPFFSDVIPFVGLTLEETNWLQNNKVFSLGIETSWYPFEFVDEKGNFKGIAADYVNQINKSLDIELIPVDGYKWNEAFEQLKLGNIDVMSGVVKNAERSKLMNFTDPYFAVPGVIVTRKNGFYVGSLKDLKNKNVGVVRGYILYDAIKGDYPNTIMHDVDSVADGLEKVKSGEIDAYVGAIAVVNYEINKRQLNDSVMIAAFTPYKFELSMAVRKGLEPLVNILNKTFAGMDEKQKSAIANNWLSVHVQRGADIKVILMWAIPILIFLLLIIIIIVRINNRLKKEISIRERSEIKRQSLEKQLHHSQKMEALGKLTGGIAHDFNNLLGIILGYTQLLKRKYPEQPNLSEYVSEIHLAGKRAAKLTSKLLSYTRKQPLKTTQLDINTLLDKQHDVLQKILTVRIKLVLNTKTELWPVLIDRNELEDSLLNIVINAMHAMEDEHKNARLTISTRNIILKENAATVYGLPAGDYVQTTIEDNGCGMEQSTVEQIFDPFFSTKDSKGTGLGLSQVYGFVKRSNGAIKAFSELSKGSQFIILFPRHRAVEEEIIEEKIEEKIAGGAETILIVDDEEALANLAYELLSQKGYHLLKANSAEQALKILSSEKIDIVLSDIIMPKTNGYQLAAIIQKNYPSVKIQLVSGFTDKKHLAEADNTLLEQVIYKPYDEQQLYSNIRKLLDS